MARRTATHHHAVSVVRLPSAEVGVPAVGVHGGRPEPEQVATGHTDWSAITKLYEGLATIDPCLGTLVARAAAIAQGSVAGLQALDAIDDPDQVRSYQPYWVVRTELLHRNRESRRTIEAARTAIRLTTDPVVASCLRRRYPTKCPSGERSRCATTPADARHSEGAASRVTSSRSGMQSTRSQIGRERSALGSCLISASETEWA